MLVADLLTAQSRVFFLILTPDDKVKIFKKLKKISHSYLYLTNEFQNN